MTMPVPAKTYQFAQWYEQIPAGAYPLLNGLLWNIKETLIHWSSAPWTVAGSCDAATYGMDGVDRWTDSSKVINNQQQSAHSWIVLKQAAITTNYSVCLECARPNANVDSGKMTVVVSPNAFTGGTTVARPTAVDERVVYYQANLFRLGGGSNTCVTAMQSTDGEVTRIILHSESGESANFISMEKPRNPISQWTTPWLFVWAYTATAGTKACSTYLNTTAAYVGRANSVNFSAYLSCEGYAGSGIMARARHNTFTGKSPIFPVGVVTETTGARGRLGSLYDIWWTPSRELVANIALWPDDSSRKYIQFGTILLPWDGLNSSPGTVPLFYAE